MVGCSKLNGAFPNVMWPHHSLVSISFFARSETWHSPRLWQDYFQGHLGKVASQHCQCFCRQAVKCENTVVFEQRVDWAQGCTISYVTSKMLRQRFPNFNSDILLVSLNPLLFLPYYQKQPNHVQIRSNHQVHHLQAFHGPQEST